MMSKSRDNSPCLSPDFGGHVFALLLFSVMVVYKYFMERVFTALRDVPLIFKFSRT